VGLFDVHAHLTDPRLAAQEAAILARAVEAGVTTIISNGLHPADNQRVAALAARSPLVRPAFGLYPVYAVLPEMRAMGVEYPGDEEPVAAEDAIAWLESNVEDCFAVGEIGLDRYWVPAELWERQEAIFRQLVQLAMDADKPIIIHTRKAERRALEILTEMGAPRVNWHCFSSKVKLGRRIAEAGHYLSIPANARKADNFRRLLQILPRERILLETDCPYLAPERGQLNEPANVAVTAAFAAELWQCTPQAVTDQLAENFTRLFGAAP
jgi:TatD DNase family protein